MGVARPVDGQIKNGESLLNLVWHRRARRHPVGSKISILVFILLTMTLTACSSTRMTSTWKDPDSQPLHFQKGDTVIALVISPNEGVRRPAEDALAKELTSRGIIKGIPAYTIIPTEDLQNETQVKAHITGSGASGVVVMRVVGKSQKVTASPPVYVGPRHRSFYGGYYGAGWGSAYSPGYLRTDNIYSIETRLYDLKQGKLVWVGQSDTYNPSTVETVIKEIVDEAVKEMVKEGLINKP